MKEKILKNKRLFKQFTIINRTATKVYDAIQGGVDMNFYKCYAEYESGVYGWIKEHRAFNTAVAIYEQYTANDGWDTVNEMDEVFGVELKEITPEEIEEWEIELSSFES